MCKKLGGEGNCCFRFTDGWAGRCLAIEAVASEAVRPDLLLAATRLYSPPSLQIMEEGMGTSAQP